MTHRLLNQAGVAQSPHRSEDVNTTALPPRTFVQPGSSSTLTERVLGYVVAHPGSTGYEISRGVKARHADVLEVLRGAGFTSVPRLSYTSDKAQVYLAVPVAQEQQGTAPGVLLDQVFAETKLSRTSQNGRLLTIMARGGWWTTRDLLRLEPCIVHSRIADLKKVGQQSGLFRVEHEGHGGGADKHSYRVVWASGEATTAAVASPDAPTDGNADNPVGVNDSLTSFVTPQDGASEPVQLQIGEAA